MCNGNQFSIIKHFVTFCMCQDLDWNPLWVDSKTSHDICDFIMKKYGSKEEGWEAARYVNPWLCILPWYKQWHLNQYSIAVLMCTILTFWYKTIWPNESIMEWCQDNETGLWCICQQCRCWARWHSHAVVDSHGLPMRSQTICYMLNSGAGIRQSNCRVLMGVLERTWLQLLRSCTLLLVTVS